MTGLAVGLYVVAICLSGSVLVFRQEFYGMRGRTRMERGNGAVGEELKVAAKRAYPTLEARRPLGLRNRTNPAEV